MIEHAPAFSLSVRTSRSVYSIVRHAGRLNAARDLRFQRMAPDRRPITVSKRLKQRGRVETKGSGVFVGNG